ncbi:MAG: DUF4933 domain-containing protein [Bacteroidales bacterium]|nr:DUF4933 domain-containing protein [Bacteroidales bacterium]
MKLNNTKLDYSGEHGSIVKYLPSLSCLLYLLILLNLITGVSCHRNRLRTNEKDLAQEIRIQENKNKESGLNVGENKSGITGNSFSSTIRKKEIRKVDPQRPPVLIQLPGEQDNARKFKLSDIAASVRYVKLETPPDTILLNDPFFFRNSLISSIHSDGERIIFQGLFGLTNFDMNGKYIGTIWKNESGIEFYKGSPGMRLSDFFGILPSVPVSLFGDNIYFDFSDGPAKNGLVMKYKPRKERQIEVQSLEELPGQSMIPGDTLLGTHNYSVDRFERIYGIGPDSWAGINNKWNSGKSGTLLVTYNDSGDTICSFTDYERIVDFTKNLYRRPVDLISYQSEGLLTIKPEYNDTVFRLVGPDRLLPVYIIDFGGFKISFKDGLDPDLDLSEKLMLKSLNETSDYLLIRYTQNNDSPNNVRKNAVKVYNVLFNKKRGKLYHQPGFTLLPEGMQNDIDEGMPFWPDFVTPRGEMMKLVSGKIIKDFVTSEGFKIAAISDENRRKQVSMATGLKNTDMIIMIVK